MILPRWKDVAKAYKRAFDLRWNDLLLVAKHLNPYSRENEVGFFQLQFVAERVVRELEARRAAMTITEPISIDAPCAYCDSAPRHKPECLWKPVEIENDD